MTDDSAHARASALLPWYVNGTLEPGEQASVEAHLPHCPRCRCEVALLRQLSETVVAEPSSAPPAAEVLSRAGWLRRTWWLTPTVVRGAVVAQAATLAALIVWGVASPGPAVSTYATLDEARPASVASGFRLQLIVAGDTAEERLRALLLDHELRIVDGPSPLGVYTVAAGAGTEEEAAALAEALLARPEVRLAAPLP